MLSVALFSVALGLAPAVSPAASVLQDGYPIEVWLNKDERIGYGDKVRVYLRTESDGHVVVLHADPEGRIRVLFPIDPFEDDFVRGGRAYELRDRSDREAVRTMAVPGIGTVYAAYSPDPFDYTRFVLNDHWDFRALGEVTVDGNAEDELTDLVEQMALGPTVRYDVADYYVSEPVYARHRTQYVGFSGYRPYYYDPYWSGFSFGVSWGYRPYSRWGFHVGYGDPWYYDPWYYDPWYYRSSYGRYYYDPFFYDPWWGRSRYRYGTYVYSPVFVTENRYYASVNRRYTFKGADRVPSTGYRRRLAQPGTLATSPTSVRRQSPAGSRRVASVGTGERSPAASRDAGRRAAPPRTGVDRQGALTDGRRRVGDRTSPTRTPTADRTPARRPTATPGQNQPDRRGDNGVRRGNDRLTPVRMTNPPQVRPRTPSDDNRRAAPQQNPPGRGEEGVRRTPSRTGPDRAATPPSRAQAPDRTTRPASPPSADRRAAPSRAQPPSRSSRSSAGAAQPGARRAVPSRPSTSRPRPTLQRRMPASRSGNSARATRPSTRSAPSRSSRPSTRSAAPSRAPNRSARPSSRRPNNSAGRAPSRSSRPPARSARPPSRGSNNSARRPATSNSRPPARSSSSSSNRRRPNG